MTVKKTTTLRYRWDSGGGWYEIPAEIFDLIANFKVRSTESRVSHERKMYFLEGERDGKRFINRLQKLLNGKQAKTASEADSEADGGLEIVEICEGARSSIRDLESARGEGGL